MSKSIIDTSFNFFIIIISLAFSLIIPFELFLLAYVLLGPLHYFTEINWLRKRNYFVKEKAWFWFFLMIAILASLPIVLEKISDHQFCEFLSYPVKFLRSNYPTFIFFAFVLAAAISFQVKLKNYILFILICIIIYIILNRTETFYPIFAILIPSIIHVYFFTVLFMINSAIKSYSATKIFEIAIILFIPFLIAFLPVNEINLPFRSEIILVVIKSNFFNLNSILLQIVNAIFEIDYKAQQSLDLLIKIQTFISFAYVYHYLNWFSKVSVIGWLRNTSSRTILVLIFLWLISLSLYIYDFQIGLLSLYFFSLFHVVLEFPLNMLTIDSIFSKLISSLKIK